MTAGEYEHLIYGLEFQARSLATQTAPHNVDCDVTRFMIGTQTLKLANNQIHIIEIGDEASITSQQVYPHPVGELWHLHWSAHNPQLISSCYNMIDEKESAVQKCSLWTLPEKENTLELVSNIDCDDEIRVAFFHPSDNAKFLTVADSKFFIWDISKDSPREVFSKPIQGKGSQKFANGKWNPQESGASLATLQETMVKGWDLRSAREAWTIDQAHLQAVRDIDYNKNRQHVLCSCGDDGLVKIWDLRALTNPLLTLSGHSHWAWCVRYNPLHDGLILSSGSDASGRLWWAASVASDPLPITAKNTDGPLQQYTAMEDSVYAAEWSGADPWTFALLSYDGRLLIHRVPKQIKLDILVQSN
ncbi:EARP-interacting protein homolog [Cimex lectularius]|uniref:EIPR1-like beta-propeller domain-containing protein n=1 Tax=Cimex lectularius TaxID=79782 RepID=A0A8I6SKD7_CIMLE|nr:EARP-interacting protein homolog [Cimex lectularius]XP_024084845.1 EARP-interacting protein homolog [Cimex lectularius]